MVGQPVEKRGRHLGVADAIAQLVEAAERRPLRTVVMPEGMDLGVQRLNEAVGPIQNDLLTSLGMSSML